MVNAPKSKRAGKSTTVQSSAESTNSHQDWNTVLELLATGAPLQLSLEAIIGKLEAPDPSARCAIMALDNDGSSLRHLAAPSLPVWYCESIDGLKLSPSGHCCAVAAHTRRRVVVRNIQVDRAWLEIDPRAKEAGLRACWCKPVFSMSGDLLGTFAIYHVRTHLPGSDEQGMVMTAARLTGIAMERTRSDLELRLAKETAERASRAKSEFLANVSHELRTPLNAIIGFSEMMKEGLLGPQGITKYREYAEDIHTSARHLLDLINDVLDLSRFESGHAELHPEEVRVADLIDASLSLVRELATRNQVTLKHSIGADLPPLYADPLKMKQIFVNLVTNAIKFSSPESVVSIDARLSESGDLEVSVSDQGVGMSAEDVKVALEPFRQVGGGVATNSRQGVGLGLPLSKTLTELHDGTLEIESEPGQGTVVQITLPPERLIQSA